MSRSCQDHDEHSLEQSCLLCGQPDTSQMVSCDECQRWYHFACVGVTDAIADYDWSCQRCQGARISAPAITTSAVTSISHIVPSASAEMLPEVTSVSHNTAGIVNIACSVPPNNPSTNQRFCKRLHRVLHVIPRAPTPVLCQYH